MINHYLHPHQQYTAKFDPISKLYNIFHWSHIQHQINYIDSKPVLEKYLAGDIIDTAKTEKEVWEKLLALRMFNQKLLQM